MKPEDIIEAFQKWLSKTTGPLTRADYREVLEGIAEDVETNLMGLTEDEARSD